MRSISLVFVVGLFAASLLTPGATRVASAQDTMPTAADLPIAPDPALCLVEPRPVDFFEQFLGTPAATPSGAGVAELEGTIDAFVPPEGDPADAATVDAVVATAVEITACFNAGDLLGAFALYTDAMIESLAAEDPLPQEEFDVMAASPVAMPAEERERVLAVRDVVILPDGRAGGFVDFEFAGGYLETQYAVLVEQDGRWLVDEILLYAPSEGTPTP
jgi:hypothetical protein